MAKNTYKKRLNLIILGVVALIFLVSFSQGANMKYKVEGDNLRITWFKGVVIPIKDITEVQILDTKPKMNRIVGMDMFKVQQGTYSLEGIGRVRMYASNINRKIVLVKTDKMTYAVTPENPEEFKRSIGF